MARKLRHGQTDLSAQTIAGVAAIGIFAGLLFAVGGHFLGQLFHTPPPVVEKQVRMKPHRGPTPVQLLDAQQPRDTAMEYPSPPADTES